MPARAPLHIWGHRANTFSDPIKSTVLWCEHHLRVYLLHTRLSGGSFFLSFGGCEYSQVINWFVKVIQKMKRYSQNENARRCGNHDIWWKKFTKVHDRNMETYTIATTLSCNMLHKKLQSQIPRDFSVKIWRTIWASSILWRKPDDYIQRIRAVPGAVHIVCWRLGFGFTKFIPSFEKCSI